MATMSDHHVGLLSFQQAMDDGQIAPEPARFDRDLLLFVDKPDENVRLAYAVADAGR
jgi:hypothetical protein